MSIEYTYDHTSRPSKYNTLANLGSYKCTATCFSPSAPQSYRSQRDQDDWKRYVVDRWQNKQENYCAMCQGGCGYGCGNRSGQYIPSEQTTPSVKENFCVCGGGRPCGINQYYNRDLNILEQQYNNGQLTENNFPQK